MWQPEGSEIIDPSAVVNPLAAATVRYLNDHCQDFAELRECRRFPDGGMEIVSLRLNVEVPQHPVYDIRATELISVCFVSGNQSAPGIVVARQDFPDTPHQNIVPEGFPSMICIDDRPWVDVRGGYTASELITRIFAWFSKAGQGELHGADQPFDPFFGYDSPHQIILTTDGISALEAREKLNVWSADKGRKFLLLTSAEHDGVQECAINFHFVQVDVDPQRMSRIRRAPRTMAGLVSILQDRQPAFVEDLKISILEWFESGKRDDDSKWLFGILARFPQIHPRTGEIGATKPMAFLSEVSPGQMGVALGILDPNVSEHADGVKYLKSLFPKTEPAGLEKFGVQVAQVHVETDAHAAALLAGHTSADTRRVALVGAGSLGSALAENLTREGFFKWTVIDDDELLPHNLSRHDLTRQHLGLPKAPCLANRLLAIRGDAAPVAIVENVLSGSMSQGLSEALESADLILDASASVPVSRSLSDRPGAARRMCAFFTPDGGAAVLMLEAADRSTTLRGAEAVYLHEALTNPALEGHFSAAQQLRYTGACRALTSRIPMSRVAVLAGLISSGITSSIGSDAAALKIWPVGRDGSVSCIKSVPIVEERAVGDWRILLPSTLRSDLVRRREESLPNETGGALLGMIDYDARIISVIHSPEPPVDSVGKPASFVRGTRGLRRAIETAERRSGGQVRYIGEWHSHPRGVSAAPSAIDLVQIRDLSLVLDMDGLPAVSLILSDDDLRILIGKVQ